MISISNFILIISLLYGSGFIIPIVARRWRAAPVLSIGFALLGSLAALYKSAAVWFGPTTPTLEIFVIPVNFWKLASINAVILPPLNWQFAMDSLSAFFAFLISAFCVIVAIYSFTALNAAHYRPYRVRIASAFSLFAWATLMVTLAYDGISLLIALEIMTLAFAYLALYKHNLYLDAAHPVSEEKTKDARLAPQVYLMISHTSTTLLIVAVILLATSASGFGFDAWIARSFFLSPSVTIAVFSLALAGLAIRAGMVPAHFWVSLVHPSSPTPTHALSLGIAIKVAVYLMYRFFFQFISPRPWMGYLLLALAVLTALVNVFYAISSHDLKTALAYHSIENIGIICTGIGVALIFWNKFPVLSILALVASLYHLLNHAVFKGLLYLATGVVDNLTHQVVDFSHLGGLIRLYPFTTAMFLIGSFAIAGFPPLNGFVSEWLTLQALFHGLEKLKLQYGVGLLFLLSLLGLVAAFALTAFCFYKIAGLTFLGGFRTNAEGRKDWEKKDVPFNMGAVMLLMAGLCLGLGLLPGLVVPHLMAALTPVGGSVNILFVPAAWKVIPGQLQAWPVLPSVAELNLNSLNLLSFLVPALALLIFPFAARLKSGKRQTSISWNCGEDAASPAHSQYTGSALSSLLRGELDLFKPRWTLRVRDYLPAHLVLSQSKNFPQEVIEIFRLGYNAITGWLVDASETIGSFMQNSDIRRYLQYILIANIVILVMFIILGINHP
jgi:hydrogenase-4 component B